MILVDTNLLLYATVDDLAEHSRARQWLREQLSNGSRIGLPWTSLLGFVRLASNRNAFVHGLSVDDAWSVARQWLSADNVWIPQPTERHAEVLERIFTSVRLKSSAVTDTHLAALAIEHGLVLCSADAGFARFHELRWFNPLAT